MCRVYPPAQITRAYDIQNQRLVAVSGELARAAAELNDLRLRHEGNHVSGNQVAQQVRSLGGVSCCNVWVYTAVHSD